MHIYIGQGHQVKGVPSREVKGMPHARFDAVVLRGDEIRGWM